MLHPPLKKMPSSADSSSSTSPLSMSASSAALHSTLLIPAAALVSSIGLVVLLLRMGIGGLLYVLGLSFPWWTSIALGTALCSVFAFPSSAGALLSAILSR